MIRSFGELSALERRQLAYDASINWHMQQDPRYWNSDPEERARLLARWQLIEKSLKEYQDG